MNPNQRIQDGLKYHWLCEECEGVLNKSETIFATHLFHPYSSGGSGGKYNYGPWLLHFCVSLSWRVLRFYQEETDLDGLSAEVIGRLDAAEAVWREFLLGMRPHPGQHRHHLIPLDAIENSSGSLEPNINRYLMRAVDMDLVRGETTEFIYSKIGRFVVVGFVREDKPGYWRGAKINANLGTVEPRNYVLPRHFGDYLNQKARRMAEIARGISPRQKQKIDAAFRSNVEQFVGSDQCYALMNDIRLFGDEAIEKESD